MHSKRLFVIERKKKLAPILAPKKQIPYNNTFTGDFAERKGFEPSVQLPAH